MKLALLTGLILSLPLSALAGGPPQDPPDINFQFKVDQAIDKGMAYLKGKRTGSYHKEIENGNELILLTYLHAGAPERYPGHKADVDELVKYILESKLERTYKVALTAMCLEEYDRAKYQWRIHQCAQFLADNVDNSGLTRYGQPSIFTEDIEPTPTISPRKAVSTSGKSRSSSRRKKQPVADPHRRAKPPIPKIIQVKRQRAGEADHDHSNMQYHALGLRACHDAGIRFEKSLLLSVDKHWRANQSTEQAKKEPLAIDPPKGQRRVGAQKAGGTVASIRSKSVAPQGWGYTGKSKPHGSMTVGAIGGLCILDYMLDKDWRKDEDVLEGMQWLNKNWSVTDNPGKGKQWYMYYMYAIERAGMLFGTETIGDHKWYREGAEQLLSDQGGDGSWGNVVDTCFAILFLRRATRPLNVATGGSR